MGTLQTIGATCTLGLLIAAPARADWHEGQITALAIGYGGTISFRMSGWSRGDCTCNGSWASMMCLDPNRASFKEEYAWLLSARARDQHIQVNIDEATCKVVATYE